jgi:hemerythrin
MMHKLVEWTKEFSVGVPEIDEQHKKLFEIINSFFDGLKSGHSQKSMVTAFDEVVSYTKYHFEAEERYMDESQYADRQNHKRVHKQLILRIEEFQKDFEHQKNGISLDFLQFLAQWLPDHILFHDKQYAPFNVHPKDKAA